MATRDQEARSLVEAARAAEAMLGQTLPDMVAARPPDVVIPPVPRSVVGPDGTIQTMPPSEVMPLPRGPGVDVGNTGSVYPNAPRRRYCGRTGNLRLWTILRGVRGYPPSPRFLRFAQTCR
jgi:hypothetical protein